MELEQMKKLYATGEWICVAHQRDTGWYLSEEFPLYESLGITYQLISTKHAHILDAYLDGCEIYYDNSTSHRFTQLGKCHKDWIEMYCDSGRYLAIPKSLENYYCLGTKENFDRLQANGCKLNGIWHDRVDYWWICPERGVTQVVEGSPAHFRSKQIEYNTQINQWVYCLKENEDGHSTS